MKRALVVGINDYQYTSKLAGCINDAMKISERIKQNEDSSPNFEVQTLTSDKDDITVINLKSKLNDLLNKPGEMAYFYFSGHGTVTNVGGAICTKECRKFQEGISMQELLTLVNNSPVKEIIVMLDCCFSGALGQIPAYGSGNNQITIKEGVSILTASRDTETAIEVDGAGIFTTLVCDALDGSAADIIGTITPAGIYAHVEQSLGAWDQRPLFKSYVSRSTPLRKVKPKVELQDLRNLPTLFKDAESKYRMDPSYEYTEKTAKAENVEIFNKLKRMQIVGLLKVNGTKPDLYWAAINSWTCELTPTGKFYWSLAKSNRI